MAAAVVVPPADEVVRPGVDAKAASAGTPLTDNATRADRDLQRPAKATHQLPFPRTVVNTLAVETVVSGGRVPGEFAVIQQLSASLRQWLPPNR